jgi:hypothetical protein
MKKIACSVIGCSLLAQPVVAENLFFEATGKISSELTLYQGEGQFTDQNYSSDLAIAIEPELFWQWNNQQDSLTFKPFFRKDQRDSQRTHTDISELSWVHLGDDWELRSGFRKVFWGVTEFQNVVDVINQKDFVEGIDNENKLGQPMINLSFAKDWGTLDLFVLPGFREQTYAGQGGRLRAGLAVDDDLTSYEASNNEQHVDLALRWTHSFDVFDIGTHWFKGTDRNPQFSAISIHGKNALKAHYQQIEQVGIDAQATIDNWLWKGEAIYQQNSDQNFLASQAGFEYTFYGIQDSAADLGILMEYSYDQRGRDANSIMQNDIGFGARLALNDTQSSSLLAGFIHDLDFNSNIFSLEAQRRIGDNWKGLIEARFFSSANNTDPLTNFEDDDYVRFTLEHYF